MERLTKRDEDGFAFVISGYTKRYGEFADKLAAYEDAEEQGLLIRLPFSVGTRVYEIVEDCTNEFSCVHHEDEDEDERDCNKCQYLKQRVYERHYMSKEVIVYNMYKFGKTVFLTREEAEAALERMGK